MRPAQFDDWDYAAWPEPEGGSEFTPSAIIGLAKLLNMASQAAMQRGKPKPREILHQQAISMTNEYFTSFAMQLGHRIFLLEAFAKYMKRHDIRAAANLTVEDDEVASLIAEHLSDQIAGRTVIEIGGGTGLLALHLAERAMRMFCIEANPVWALLHAELFPRRKPKNLSYLFGSADEFAGLIKGNVALFCTHSTCSRVKRGHAFRT